MIDATQIITAAMKSEHQAAAAMADIRRQRDANLAAGLWRVERYRTQLEAGLPTSDTATQYQSLLVYLQQLRDFPQNCDPTNPSWPEVI
jgi:hypothetical protein